MENRARWRLLGSTDLDLNKIIVCMKILHTADWHLGDRLGRIDRTQDLRRAVERVADYCKEHEVDVLLVAGDVFSELSRPDSLRESIEHLQRTFEPFLLRGGTILAVTGNHDNETFCQTLQLVMTLAAPAAGRAGELLPRGRLYLATSPTLLRLADPQGGEVQFVMMPYPTPTHYLREQETQRYGSLEEKNRLLQAAYTRKLREMQDDPHFRADLPTVLAAHIHVQGAALPSLFRISEEESIVFAETDMPDHFAYVALGHIHQPQCIRGLKHVRYSSSIERLDLGERTDDKGVVLFEIGPRGLIGEPRFLPLEATTIYSVEVRNPATDLPALRDRYPSAEQDLVNLQITYTAGVDNLEEVLRELEVIFPRWYARAWIESGALGPTLTLGEATSARSFEDTVRDYLRQELANHPPEDCDAVLLLAENLMREVQS
jgi:DNA repair protein SbcD/Mre11